jgi:hypothetical protein
MDAANISSGGFGAWQKRRKEDTMKKRNEGAYILQCYDFK